MIIKKISIENFRGIKNRQEIPLSNFSSIVGKNDSGKSIILHAIASFLNLKDYKIIESDFNDKTKEIVIECHLFDENIRGILIDKIKSKIKKDDGLEEFLNDIVFDHQIVIQKKIKVADKDFSVVSFLVKDFNNPDFNKIYQKTDEELSGIIEKYSIQVPVSGKGRNAKLEKIKYIKEYCNSNSIEIDNVWNEDIYKINEVLPGAELFVSDYGLEADTKFKTNSVSEIKDFFDLETSDDTKRLSSVQKDIEKEMSKEAEKIKKFMCDYTSSLEEIIITPNISWPKSIEGVDVSFKFADDSLPIIMSHKGAGYRRLFMVARFRYLAEKNKGQQVIYLIEEPETFLHPSAQEDLLNALKILSDNNQVVITTHSPVFVGSTNVDSVILCKKQSQSIYESANTSNGQAFIESIINELGIKPYYNLREKFEKIVFVEGKHDVVFYDQISLKINNKSLKDNKKILILPFGGSCVDSFVNIEYFEDQGRPLFLIIDSDKGLKNNPEKIKKQEELVKEFNKRKNGKAYLLKKSSIENYWHPKTLEKILIITADALNIFADDDCMKDKIIDINKKYNKNLSKNQNGQIFNLMTKEEFEEVVEPGLVDFLNGIA